MSVGKKTIQYTAAAVLVAIAIIGASFVYIGIPNVLSTTGTNSSTNASSISGPTSTLLIQLTDPPQVPALTTSLNMTYTSIGILVGEPGSTPGRTNTTTVTITPQGGSGTVDLLKLQNLSQTLATASLPNDTVIYSVTFSVSSISIDVNGTVSSVAFATGSNSLLITIANPSSITGTNVALLQLNPVVVETATGYQMIPSAVGLIQHNHGQGETEVGSQHKLTNEDLGNLSRSSGSATVALGSMQVNGNQTTMTVLVHNTGNISIVVNGIGVHGNFSVTPSCLSSSQTSSEGGSNSTSGQGSSGEGGSNSTSGQGSTGEGGSNSTGSQGSPGEGGSNNTQGEGAISVTPFDSGGSSGGSNGSPHCETQDHPNQLVFFPGAVSGASANACATGSMTLVNGESHHGGGNLTLAPGQCAQLTFSGMLSFGASNLVLIPSTLSGQTFGVSLMASNGANQQVSCVLPLGTASCAPSAHNGEGGD